ncbi:MAG: type II toxin-antitoxin system RelB/DinJ family antitoxin [Phycisphaerae bacterium]
MPKTSYTRSSVIRARVEAVRKARVEGIFRQLGITPTEALNLFYAQVEQHCGLPFPVAIHYTAPRPSAAMREFHAKGAAASQPFAAGTLGTEKQRSQPIGNILMGNSCLIIVTQILAMGTDSSR